MIIQLRFVILVADLVPEATISKAITISLHTFEVIVVVLGLQPLFFAVLRQK